MGDIENINIIIVAFQWKETTLSVPERPNEWTKRRINENASGELITFYVICYMTFDIFSPCCFGEQSILYQPSYVFFFFHSVDSSYNWHKLALHHISPAVPIKSQTDNIPFGSWYTLSRRLLKRKKKWKQCLLQILNCHHNMIQLKKRACLYFCLRGSIKKKGRRIDRPIEDEDVCSLCSQIVKWINWVSRNFGNEKH